MTTKYIEGNFTVVPNEFILNMKNFKRPASVLLYVFLRKHLNPEKNGNVVFPSYTKIQEHTGMTRATISGAIKEQVETGWIESVDKGFNASNRYHVNDTSSSITVLLTEQVVQSMNQSSSITELEVVQSLDTNNTNITKLKNNNNITKLKNNINTEKDFLISLKNKIKGKYLSFHKKGNWGNFLSYCQAHNIFFGYKDEEDATTLQALLGHIDDFNNEYNLTHAKLAEVKKNQRQMSTIDNSETEDYFHIKSEEEMAEEDACFAETAKQHFAQQRKQKQISMEIGGDLLNIFLGSTFP